MEIRDWVQITGIVLMLGGMANQLRVMMKNLSQHDSRLNALEMQYKTLGEINVSLMYNNKEIDRLRDRIDLVLDKATRVSFKIPE